MGTTPTMGIPFPESTDPVANGAQNMEDLATTVDSKTGLIKIIPTGATNATISADGDVIPNNAVSSVVISGAFSSIFDSYRIVISNLGMSSTGYGTNVFCKMHDGTNPANTNYNFGIPRVDMASGAVSSLYGALATTGVVIGTGTGDKFATSFDVLNPNLPTHTIFSGLTVSANSVGYSGAGSGMHQTSTAYTGFQLAPSGGTFTGGAIRIYGYRN